MFGHQGRRRFSDPVDLQQFLLAIRELNSEEWEEVEDTIGSIHTRRSILEHFPLAQFYKCFRSKLKILLDGYAVIASGLVPRRIGKKSYPVKALTFASPAIKVSGHIPPVPWIPIVSETIATALEKGPELGLAAYELILEHQDRQIVELFPDFYDRDKHIKRIARELTEMYRDQIIALSPTGRQKLADCAVDRINRALQIGKNEELASFPNWCIQQIALFRPILKPTEKLLPLLKKPLDVPTDSPLAGCTDEDIFQRTGLSLMSPKGNHVYYHTRSTEKHYCTKTQQYGYRSVTPEYVAMLRKAGVSVKSSYVPQSAIGSQIPEYPPHQEFNINHTRSPEMFYLNPTYHPKQIPLSYRTEEQPVRAEIPHGLLDVDPRHAQRLERLRQDTHWYTDGEMACLLDLYATQATDADDTDTQIFSPLLIRDREEMQSLQRELIRFHRQRAEAIEHQQAVQNTVVIPMKLEGSSWALLYLIYPQNMNVLPQIYYFDPLGKKLPKSVSQLLNDEQLFPKATVAHIGQRTRDDQYNSSAWVIEMMRSICNKGGVLGQNFDIRSARVNQQLQLIDLYPKFSRCYEDVSKLLVRNDIDVSFEERMDHLEGGLDRGVRRRVRQEVCSTQGCLRWRLWIYRFWNHSNSGPWFYRRTFKCCYCDKLTRTSCPRGITHRKLFPAFARK